MQASYDCREPFVRVSHDVCANFNLFYFSQLSLEMVLFMSHICPFVQVAGTSLQCVCERLRRVRNICDDLTMVRGFLELCPLGDHTQGQLL